ncbi:MAG: quinone-dependent dihydroorotate dehydrogenase [Terrimicrobiaceae bacterium]
MNLYTSLLRPLMFRMDAESAHNFALAALARMPASWLRRLFGNPPPGPRVKAFGIDFPNPVGLAAGMDKNADCLQAWETLGFGFVEIGTITAKAQPGNPKPRAFRYPKHNALINRMGFNNDGATLVAARLEILRSRDRWPRVPVGINLGKSKVTPLEEAADDYRFSAKKLREYADYFVINVSSPNTPGLRELQDSSRLEAIANAVLGEAGRRPVLVKIAPDLTDEAALEVATLAERTGLHGLIATNTTLDHSAIEPSIDQIGGLSGAPLAKRSTALLARLSSATRLPVIASGGVMDAESARAKFEAGAALVQLYTGFVYHGPALIHEAAAQAGRSPAEALFPQPPIRR